MLRDSNLDCVKWQFQLSSDLSFWAVNLALQHNSDPGGGWCHHWASIGREVMNYWREIADDVTCEISRNLGLNMKSNMLYYMLYFMSFLGDLACHWCTSIMSCATNHHQERRSITPPGVIWPHYLLVPLLPTRPPANKCMALEFLPWQSLVSWNLFSLCVK